MTQPFHTGVDHSVLGMAFPMEVHPSTPSIKRDVLMKVRSRLGSFPFALNDPPPCAKGRDLEIKTFISNSQALAWRTGTF